MSDRETLVDFLRALRKERGVCFCWWAVRAATVAAAEALAMDDRFEPLEVVLLLGWVRLNGLMRPIEEEVSSEPVDHPSSSVNPAGTG